MTDGLFFVGRGQAFDQPRPAPELRGLLTDHLLCPHDSVLVRVADERAGAFDAAVRANEVGTMLLRPYRTLNSLIARAESCAASWTPVCAILMIFIAIISVRGSSRSLTQSVYSVCSYASMMHLTSFGPRPREDFSNRR